MSHADWCLQFNAVSVSRLQGGATADVEYSGASQMYEQPYETYEQIDDSNDAPNCAAPDPDGPMYAAPDPVAPGGDVARPLSIC